MCSNALLFPDLAAVIMGRCDDVRPVFFSTSILSLVLTALNTISPDVKRALRFPGKSGSTLGSAELSSRS